MNVVRLDRSTPAPRRSEQITLGMAQLSPFGLSEQWLLRDCGDRHWSLIAEATGGSMAFRDPEGHRVYAAFCTTSVSYGGAPTLGESAQVRSALYQVAAGRIGSEHVVTAAAGQIACIRMITCFLRHDPTGSNKRLLRCGVSGLRGLPDAPETLIKLDTSARQTARAARTAPLTPPVFEYTPVPELDFNAVGLLYFPVFTKIAQMAAPAVTAKPRQVIYLGNVDTDEPISASQWQGKLLLHSDGRLIGCIATGA